MAIEAHKCNVRECKGFILFENADFNYQHPPIVKGMYEFTQPTCSECGKEYKVVPHHVVMSIDEYGDIEKVEEACITEWEMREKERKFENEIDPYEKIQTFIDMREYTYKVEDIVEGYRKKKNGYYVSYTMNDCIEHLTPALEKLV